MPMLNNESKLFEVKLKSWSRSKNGETSSLEGRLCWQEKECGKDGLGLT